MFSIDITTSPSKDESNILSQGIIDFNQASVPGLERNEDEVKFTVFARNSSNEVIGGIRASCYWNTLHIELLWLSEECRGQGVGAELVKNAELFAREKGCEKALVETTSWQAKPFYEKNGYEHMATLSGRPKGQASHYLSKTL
ncbi:GNAT family N-acetyltransferase [Microbulbifer sp. VAAC004]|uniref:GNAT family N-acetyltransferase n=1 Tax=unclassified Microbulbifer TaxID=2619833 RepID=UPI00403A3B8D